MNLRESYWKYSLIVLIVFIGIILFRELSPFFSGILGALTLYILLRRQMLYLIIKKNVKKNNAVFLILGEAILCFLIPLSLALLLIASELEGVKLDPSAYMTYVQHFGELVEQYTGYDLLNKSNLLSATEYLPQVGEMIIGNISAFVVNLFILLFVLYFMLMGGQQMERYAYTLLPFNDANKKSVIRQINKMVKSNAIGIPLLAIFQGVLATIGFYIFGAPNPLLLGFLSCFATIIPILGTSLVWFPTALYLGLSGNWAQAIGLVAFSLIVVAGSDNLIRFAMQKRLADTHPLITIFGVVIGLTLFGFWGVIFGPLLLSFFILCIDIFKREYLDVN